MEFHSRANNKTDHNSQLMKKIFLIIPIVALILCSYAEAATVYVRTDGHDTNCDGTVNVAYDGSGGPDACAYLTIQKGVDVSTDPADQICVDDGTYTTGFTMSTSSGSSGNPILMRNCSGGTVTVDNSISVSGWESIGGNLWESDPVAAVSNPMWINGSTYARQLEFCVDVNSQNEYCNAGGGVVRLYSTTDPNLSTWKMDAADPINVLNVSYVTLDGIGGVYSDVVLDIGNVNNTTDTNNTNNIIVKNATYGPGGLRVVNIIGSILNPINDIKIENCVIHDSDDFQDTANGHCIKISSNQKGFHNAGVEIADSTIYNCDKHALQFSDGWSDGWFHNNRIYNFGVSSSFFSAGIRIGETHGAIVEDNDIGNGAGGVGTSTTGAAVFIQAAGTDAIVRRNKLHDTGFYGVWINCDTPGEASTGSLIYDNLIYRNARNGISVEETNSTYIYNNSFWGNGTSGLSTASAFFLADGTGTGPDKATGVVFKNNSIHSPSNAKAITGVAGTDMVSDNNILFTEGSTFGTYNGVTYATFSLYQAASLQDASSFETNPLFTDPSNADFSIAIGSPGFNTGQTLVDVPDDYYETARPQFGAYDIGAYEASTGCLTCLSLNGVSSIGVNKD